MWAMATMLVVLEGPCGVIGVYVELGEKREVIIMGVTILMSFDMLEGWAEGELLERMSNFIKNIPIRGEGSRWRLVAGCSRRRVKRCPFFIEQIGRRKGGLESEYLVNEGQIITRNETVSSLHSIAILEQSEKKMEKGQHTIPFCTV